MEVLYSIAIFPFAWFYLTVGYLCGKDVRELLANEYRSWPLILATSFVSVLGLATGFFLVFGFFLVLCGF